MAIKARDRAAPPPGAVRPPPVAAIRVEIAFAWIVDYDNDNEYENDNGIEISSTVCSRFAE
jgi:hypothetical protein